MNAFIRLAAAASLVTAFAGCMTPPSNLDLSREKPSEAGRYRVAVVAPSPAPAVNQLHAWKVMLADAQGLPVRDARFTVGGGMPQHGHGFPTRPRVTRQLDDGSYLLEGMKFSMTGWWDLKLGIQGERGWDEVTFNIVVDPRDRAAVTP